MALVSKSDTQLAVFTWEARLSRMLFGMLCFSSHVVAFIGKPMFSHRWR